MDTKTEKWSEYAIVEMMGHRKIAGQIFESEIGVSLLRVDVLNGDGEVDRTEHIGIASIYCLTIVSKEVAEAVAKVNVPKPSFAYDLPNARVLAGHTGNYSNDVNDEDYEDGEGDY